MTNHEIIEYLYSIVDYDNYYNLILYRDYCGKTRYKPKKCILEYSNEELDFYLKENSTSDEYEILELLKEEPYMKVLDLKKTANISTRLERLGFLYKTLNSIKGQFDEVRIYVNKSSDDNITLEIEEQLNELSKNYTVIIGDDIGHDGRFYWASNIGEYYFTLSDAVIYPENYVKETLPEIGRRVVCYAGKIINSSSLNFLNRNHRRIFSWEFLSEHRVVDIVDTAYMAFNSNIYQFKLGRYPIKNLTNLLISLDIAMLKKRIFCLSKPKNWIISPNSFDLFNSLLDKSGESVSLLKMISEFKNLTSIKIKKDIFDNRICKDGLEAISIELSKYVSESYKTIYHIGSGVGTNLIHLSMCSSFKNYIGIDTESNRVKFSLRTYHGIQDFLDKNIYFVCLDFDRLTIDNNSVVLLNNYMDHKVLDNLWSVIPRNTIVISFDKTLLDKPIFNMNVQMLNGDIQTIYFYKKTEEIKVDFEFLNLKLDWKTEKSKKKIWEIPKIIHHIAPTDKQKWHYRWQDCLDSWFKVYPDWEHKFWDDEDIEKLIDDDFPWYRRYYDLYTENIKKYDIARILILYKYGGVYADMDYEVLNDFSDKIVLGRVSIPISSYKLNEYFQNSFFISNPKNIFWLMLLDYSIDKLGFTQVMDTTGPILLTQFYFGFYPILKNMVNELPTDEFIPNDKLIKQSNLIYTRHNHTNSWTQTKPIKHD